MERIRRIIVAILCIGAMVPTFSHAYAPQWPDRNDYRSHLDAMINGSKGYNGKDRKMMFSFLQENGKHDEYNALWTGLKRQKWQRRMRWIQIGALSSLVIPTLYYPIVLELGQLVFGTSKIGKQS